MIPQDFSLPIPGPLWLMGILAVVTFLLHILFVNITVSTAVGAVVLQIAGRVKRNDVLDKMAQTSSFHASIHKSLAVVMGVAPTLIVSVIYAQYFYSSTILIGKMWMSIIVLLIVAFLLLYIYKFKWGKWPIALHMATGIGAVLILLFIPLIFLVNVVSMIHPEQWREVNGFWQALVTYPQIFQRYAHFMLATFITGGFYFYMYYSWIGKKRTLREDEVALKRFGVRLVLWSTALQFVTGTLVFLSMKEEVRLALMGNDVLLTTLFFAGVGATALLCIVLYRLTTYHSRRLMVTALLLFTIVVVSMGWMRHEIRQTYLDPYFEQYPRNEYK